MATDTGGAVINSLMHNYRSFLRRCSERMDHDRLVEDARMSAEHRIAHQRVLASGGDCCPYCLEP